MSGKRYHHVNTAGELQDKRGQRSTEPSTNYSSKGALQTEEAPNLKAGVQPAKTITGKEKQDTYPPIVTIDGRVDTDIDHLIDDLTDDYTGPVDDIPSKFPKPHVFSVVEGSLDDDVDSYANDDGTMEHTLVDAPKAFNPRDLKDVASNDANRKAQGHDAQLKISHTDRSHNKMYVEPSENDGSFDQTSNPEVQEFMSKNSSTDELKGSNSTSERTLAVKSINTCSSEDFKKLRETKRRQTPYPVRKIRSASKSEGGKTPRTDSDRQSSSHSDHQVLDAKRGHDVLRTPRFGSPASEYGTRMQGITEPDAELSFSSQVVMPLICKPADISDYSDMKERGVKEAGSPPYMRRVTDSLTCTNTDVSYRESRVDMDQSLMRLEQEQSHSESESDSDESDEQENRGMPPKIYGNFAYGLQANVGPDFEPSAFQFPCYSDESVSKSSDLCPRSRYVTQSNTHFSSAHGLDSYIKQAIQATDCLTTSESNKSDHSIMSSKKTSQSLKAATNVGLSRSSCVDGKTYERVQSSNYQQIGIQRVSSQQSNIQHANAQKCNTHQANVQQTIAQLATLKDKKETRSSPLESHKSVFSSQETSAIATRKSSEASTPTTRVSFSTNIQNETDTSMKQKSAFTDIYKPENTPAVSPPRAREMNNMESRISPLGEFDQNKYPRILSPISRPRSLPKMDRQNTEVRKPDASRKEQICGVDTSPTCDHAVQVKLERVAREVNEMEQRHDFAQAQTSLIRTQNFRPAESDESVKYKASQALQQEGDPSITQEGYRNFISDGESLDSESKQLLQQLKMVQTNKKKADRILKHVHSILEQPGKNEENLHKETGDDKKTNKIDERTLVKHLEDGGTQPNSAGQSPDKYSTKENSSGTLKKAKVDKQIEREHRMSPDRDKDHEIHGSNSVETGDKGLVQALVKNWDKHHKRVTQKDEKTHDGETKHGKHRPEMPVGHKNTTVTKHREDTNIDQISPSIQRRVVSPVTDLQHQSRAERNKFCRSPEVKRECSRPSAGVERRGQRNVHEKTHHASKRTSSEQAQKPVPAARKSVPHKKYYDSTSLASYSTDSVCTYRQYSPMSHHVSEKYSRDDTMEKRAASVPRKTKTSLIVKRKSSPDFYSNSREFQKSIRKSSMEAKRSSSRKSTIHDSLKAAFRVAEESMTAAARVAEALNVVIKASQISPTSSSSVEEKDVRRHSREQTVSPPSRSKHSDAAISSKARGASRKVRSPRQSPKAEHGFHKVLNKKVAKKADRANMKSHHQKLQETSQSNKTLPSSPSRRDTFSRNPKNVRADGKHLDGESKLVDSRGSDWPAEHSPKAWGDISKVSKDVLSHDADVTNAQQLTIQIALSPESPHIQEIIIPKERSKQITDYDSCPNENHSFVHEEYSLRFDAMEHRDRSKADPLLCMHTTDKMRAHELENSNMKRSATKTLEFDQSSDITLSKEEWVIPNSLCNSARKTEGYFTQIPPVIDHKLQNISLSAKRVIRHQLVGSCVDPGLTDSAGSDSIEFNANFNRYTASKQQLQFCANTGESRYEVYADMDRAESRRGVHSSSNRSVRRHEMNNSSDSAVIKREANTNAVTADRKRAMYASTDRAIAKHGVCTRSSVAEVESSLKKEAFLIWQQGGSFHQYTDSSPSERNMYNSDDDRSSSLTPSAYEAATSEFLGRGQQEGPRNRERLCCNGREKFQRYTEKVVQKGDYLEDSGVNQRSPGCVTALCYTDLSSPSSLVEDQQQARPQAAQQLTNVDGGSEKKHFSTRSHDSNAKCAGPLPKPRVRVLEIAEMEGFPFPGRAPNFSPIYEELWSEDDLRSVNSAERNKRITSSIGKNNGKNLSNNNSSSDQHHYVGDWKQSNVPKKSMAIKVLERSQICSGRVCYNERVIPAPCSSYAPNLVQGQVTDWSVREGMDDVACRLDLNTVVPVFVRN